VRRARDDGASFGLATMVSSLTAPA
jgi:hypothetical protein